MTMKLKLLLIILLWGGLGSGYSLAGDLTEPKTLFVSGIKDETNNKEWRNLLIAHGIVNLVEEELFATGLFVPLENKSEIEDQIRQMIEYAWRPPLGQAGEPVQSINTSVKSDVEVSGIVKNFRKKRSRAFAGPFSKATVTISFVVELFLKEKGELICSGQGKGQGKTRSKAVFFQIREDKIQFDKTSVGKAARKAVGAAVKEMVENYESTR